jgi:S-adenosyl methyltransferase
VRTKHGESWMSPQPQDPEASDAEPKVPAIDTSVAHSARRYDYWLGGKDNFAADRASGDAIAAAFPTVRTAVIENRRWVRRAAAYLAEE